MTYLIVSTLQGKYGTGEHLTRMEVKKNAHKMVFGDTTITIPGRPEHGWEDNIKRYL